MKASDFNYGDLVLYDRKCYKVLKSRRGWVTIVALDKCQTLISVIMDSINVRPNQICFLEQEQK